MAVKHSYCKKSVGTWKMCINLTSLNKFCPKDSYPLPLIVDQFIDRRIGHELFSFINAHSDYNQIPMNKTNEEKSSFISEIGTYCYTRMSFGLKNIGVTFQKLMDKIFKNQINRNVEDAYINDILVKSKLKTNHFQDLEETFSNLRKSGIKLKPSKCIFGVEKKSFSAM